MLNFKEWLVIVEAVGYYGGPLWAGLRNKSRLMKKAKSDPQLATALWQDIYTQLKGEGWSGNPIHANKCLRHNFTTYEDEMNLQRKIDRGCEKFRERMLLTAATADLVAGLIDLMPQQYRVATHEANKQWVRMKQQEYQGEQQRFIQNGWLTSPCPPEYFAIPANFAA